MRQLNKLSPEVVYNIYVSERATKKLKKEREKEIMIKTATMEKRFAIGYNGMMSGAFENVEAFEDSGDIVSFRSSEGEFVFVKNANGKYSSKNFNFEFDKFECVGARTLKKRIPQLAAQLGIN